MSLHFGGKDIGSITEKWEPHILNVKIVEGLEHLSDVSHNSKCNTYLVD